MNGAKYQKSAMASKQERSKKRTSKCLKIARFQEYFN